MSTASTTKPLAIGFGSAGMLLSPDEYDAIRDYDQQYRYELVHGVLVVNPIPSQGESDPNEELGRLLRIYREDHPSGHVLDRTLSEQYVRTHDSRRRADRVLWIGLGRRPDVKQDVPTIVVEFVSPSRRDHLRDYVEKRHEYLALGVAEYWIINRFQRNMTVYRQNDPPEQTVAENQTYHCPLLPGFELPLQRLLAIADEWGESE